MNKKAQNKESAARKVDLRNVLVSEEIDTKIDEYILKQKKMKRKVRRGDAAVELIEKGLKVEGI